jgi:ribosomal protein S18 acetylase RimI-like enzyme
MIVADWRTISAERMAALFDIERQRWRDRLHWDCSGTLADIERARVSGRLPGFVAFDGGVVRGWSYHLLHRRTLQIGGVVADGAAATARLVGAAFSSDEGRSARSSLAFGYFDAPEIESVLRDRGHSIERYHYLARALDDAEPLDPRFESYPYEDASRVAGLLQRAYEGVAAMRPFARSGRFDEWFEYLTQLTLTNACGAFDPHVSQIARDGGELKGVALVTRVGQWTAHLAQIVVDPQKQGGGLATGLLRAACASARRNGCVRISLMVGDSNHGARALYQSRGFAATEHFLLACN